MRSNGEIDRQRLWRLLSDLTNCKAKNVKQWPIVECTTKCDWLRSWTKALAEGFKGELYQQSRLRMAFVLRPRNIGVAVACSVASQMTKAAALT